MKTKKKEIKATLSRCEVSCFGGNEATYQFITTLNLRTDTKFFIEEQVPETFNDFMECNNIDELTLIEWLNVNFKK
tara:strand:+ start:1986 stop:2213 length:228 start_codon:yes stop_codon:yes gene_type:complete